MPGDRRDHPFPDHHDRLDQAGHTRGVVEVAGVRLQRADSDLAGAGTTRAQGRGCGRPLDGVADAGAGAVALQVSDGVAVDVGGPQRSADDGLLAFDGRRVVAGLRRAVVVDGGTQDDPVRGGTVVEGVGEAPQHHAGDTGSGDDAVGAGVERAAVAGGGVDAAGHVQVPRLWEGHPGGDHQRLVAVAVEQCLHGEVYRHQRRRAGGLHRQCGAVQVQPVGQEAGQEVGLGAVQRILQCQRRELAAGHHPPQVVAAAGAGEHTGGEAGVERVGAGVLKGRPGALQHQPVLRVEHLGLARAHPEQHVVEPVGVGEVAVHRHVVRVVEQVRGHPFGGEFLSLVTTGEHLAGSESVPPLGQLR